MARTPYPPRKIKDIIFKFILKVVELHFADSETRKSDFFSVINLHDKDNKSIISIDPALDKIRTYIAADIAEKCSKKKKSIKTVFEDKLNFKIYNTTTLNRIQEIRNFIGEKQPNFIAFEKVNEKGESEFYRYTISIPKDIFDFQTTISEDIAILNHL